MKKFVLFFVWLFIFCAPLFAGYSDFDEIRLATDGSTSEPSITWLDDTNTGFYRVGADQIGIIVGGSKVGEFDSTGLTDIAAIAVTAITAGTGAFTTCDVNILGGPVDCNNENMTNIDIDSGTADGMVIGGATPAAGTFTTCTATTTDVNILGGPVDCNNENMTNINIDSGSIDITTINMELVVVTSSAIVTLNSINVIIHDQNGVAIYLKGSFSE